jgi:hypothetical protein
MEKQHDFFLQELIFKMGRKTKGAKAINRETKLEKMDLRHQA